MTGKKFRVLLAESVPGEAADCQRALYPGPDSTREWSSVATLPTLVATIERARPEAIFLDLSLGKPDPLELVVFAEPGCRSSDSTASMKKALKSRARLLRSESLVGTENLAQQMPPSFDPFRKPLAGVA
jgi:hypothetical protein